MTKSSGKQKGFLIAAIVLVAAVAVAQYYGRVLLAACQLLARTFNNQAA